MNNFDPRIADAQDAQIFEQVAQTQNYTRLFDQMLGNPLDQFQTLVSNAGFIVPPYEDKDDDGHRDLDDQDKEDWMQSQETSYFNSFSE